MGILFLYFVSVLNAVYVFVAVFNFNTNRACVEALAGSVFICRIKVFYCEFCVVFKKWISSGSEMMSNKSLFGGQL